jgi:protein-tyrosine phosphatase
MPRPRGGDWLEDEVRAWRQAGVDVVVSLLTTDEVEHFDLEKEAEICRANAVEYIAFPINDRSVPASNEAAGILLSRIAGNLADGKTVAIHCRQGIGRAGMIAAAVLVLSGIDPATAIQNVSAARGCSTPETPEQRRWIAESAKWRLTGLRP